MTITGENVFISNRVPKVDLSHEKSVGHLVINALEVKNSERILLVDHSSGRQWKGSELKKKILNVAAALIIEYNLKQGTVCLVRYPCSDWYIILSLGIICAGGVLSTSDCDDPYDTLCKSAKKVKFEIFFCQESEKHLCNNLEKDVGFQINTILMDTNSSEKGNFFHLMNYDRNTLNKDLLELPVACQDKKNDWAVIQITSGTTGRPKAAVFSHENIIAEFSAVCLPEPQEVVLSNSMTLDYIAGRKMIFCGLYMGYKLILLPKHDIKLMLEVTEKYGVHMLYLSSFSLYNLVTNEMVDKYNIESVVCVCGFGSKLVFLDELREFLKKHKHIRHFAIGYGTTEVATVSRDNIEANEFLETDHGAGTLECFNRVRIVDLETGKNLGKNQKGEIRVLNSTMFIGYIDYEHSRASDVSRPIINDSKIFDELGYYITEDIGYFNDQEELFVEGRMKEVMKLNGWIVLPEVIEEVLLQQQLIHSVCVIPIQNKNNPIISYPRAFVKVYSEYCTEDVLRSSLDNTTVTLEYKGQNRLCSLPEKLRRLAARVILNNHDTKVYVERQLFGGIVIVDELKSLPLSGKIDKQYLRSLTLEQIEVYGDRSDYI